MTTEKNEILVRCERIIGRRRVISKQEMRHILATVANYEGVDLSNVYLAGTALGLDAAIEAWATKCTGVVSVGITDRRKMVYGAPMAPDVNLVLCFAPDGVTPRAERVLTVRD